MERNTVHRIIRLIRSRGGWAKKIHGGPSQERTIDIHACYKGRFLGIEAKEPGNIPTAYQLYDLEQIKRAGGLPIVAYSVVAVRRALDKIDAEVGQHAS